MAYSQEQGQLLYRVFFNPTSPISQVIQAAGARPVVNHTLTHGLDVAFIRDDPVGDAIELVGVTLTVKRKRRRCCGVRLTSDQSVFPAVIQLDPQLRQRGEATVLDLTWTDLAQLARATHDAAKQRATPHQPAQATGPVSSTPRGPAEQEAAPGNHDSAPAFTQLALFTTDAEQATTRTTARSVLALGDLKVRAADVRALLHLTHDEDVWRVLALVYHQVLLGQVTNHRGQLLRAVYSLKTHPTVEVVAQSRPTLPDTSAPISSDELALVLRDRLAEALQHRVGSPVYYKRLSLSRLEQEYQRILAALGLVSSAYLSTAQSDRAQVKAIQGTILHEVDALCNAVACGYIGDRALTLFPTAKADDVAPFVAATEGLGLARKMRQADVQAIFSQAVERFLSQVRVGTDTSALFSEQGIPDMTFEREVRHSPQTYQMALKLAQVWAEEVLKAHEQLAHYEFVPGASVRREVLAIFNLDFGSLGLQIPIRFDCLSSLPVPRGFKRTSAVAIPCQMSDLKTGDRPKDTLQREGFRRQIQLMHYLAELFTEKYFKRGFLRRRGKAYIVNVESIPAEQTGLTHTLLRWFDAENGTLDFESVQLDDAAREDFYRWRDLFVVAYHFITPEVTAYLLNSRLRL
jgi:hypothetical protein